jgi:hypothetical protein
MRVEIKNAFNVLEAFAYLQKAIITFVMSVRPSACLSAWNNSASTGRILMKVYI